MNVTTPRHSVGRERLRLFLRNPMGMFGFILVSLFFIAAIFAPMLATHDPLALDIPNRLSGPTLEHWAGTDQLGRDTFSRVLYGGRVALQVAAIGVSISLILGLGLGMLAAFSEGFIANLLAQLDDRIKNRLWPRWATGHVQIHWDQLVHTTNGGGGVGAEHATGDRAGPHGDHVLRFGHLLIEPHQGRSHFHGHRAGHDQQVSLAGRTAGYQTEAVEVEPRSQQSREFNETAGCAIEQWPEAAQPRPVVQVIQAGENDVLAQVTGDGRGTDRPAAGFPKIADRCDGRRREICHG